jgi:hypothetical protein
MPSQLLNNGPTTCEFVASSIEHQTSNKCLEEQRLKPDHSYVANIACSNARRMQLRLGQPRQHAYSIDVILQRASISSCYLVEPPGAVCGPTVADCLLNGSVWLHNTVAQIAIVVAQLLQVFQSTLITTQQVALVSFRYSIHV